MYNPKFEPTEEEKESDRRFMIIGGIILVLALLFVFSSGQCSCNVKIDSKENTNGN